MFLNIHLNIFLVILGPSCTVSLLMSPSGPWPPGKYSILCCRRWSNDLPKGVCVLVSSSVDHENIQVEAGLRAVLLTSRIFIEPCGMGRSRLTHYCRADLR